MDLIGAAFLIGPVFGLPVAAGAFAFVLSRRRSATVVAITKTLAAVVVLSFVAYWWLWGPAFDARDAGRPVSPVVYFFSNVAIGLSAAAVLLLLVVALSVLFGPAATARRRDDPAF